MKRTAPNQPRLELDPHDHFANLALQALEVPLTPVTLHVLEPDRIQQALDLTHQETRELLDYLIGNGMIYPCHETSETLGRPVYHVRSATWRLTEARRRT